MVDIADLGRKPWEFSNSHGVLSRNFWLMPEGKIGGYSHYNERGWRVVGETIELVREDGGVSCVLSKSTDENHLIYSGPALDGSANNYHSLKRPKIKTGLFLRTHFWDDATERAFNSLQKVWAGEIFICADTTNGGNFPNDKKILPHSIEKLQNIGLVDRKSYGSMLWYNGDYPIYDIALSSNFDYFVIVEYDCFVNCDLNSMVDKFIQSGDEFVSPDFREIGSSEGWIWEEHQKKSDIIDTGAGSLPVYRCFFPFVFISRTAALHLFARRLVAARARFGQDDAAWPFCESFVPTELMRAGFSCRSLDSYAGPLPYMTLFSAQSWDEVEAGNITTPFVHPVLSGQRLIDKLGFEASEREREGQGDSLEWLEAAASRNFSEYEHEQLSGKISSLQTMRINAS